MDVDDGLGGDDEVVAEMDVYLTQELAEQLYVFQYPLRPQWKPHEMASELKTVRHRALQRAVQLELQLDTSSPHYDGESQRPLETSMLSSTPVPAQTNHCVGVVSGGTVHLTPLHAVVQMRPSMAHLDEEDTARREEREREAKAEKRGARQDSAISVDANDDEDKADDDEMQMLQVQFRRAESEKVLERKRTSYASLHEAREKEPWAELAYHTRDSDESHMLRALLLCSSKAHIPFACGADDYLARLSCGRAHVRADGAGNQFGMPIDLEQEQPSVSELPGLSKEALRQMRPSERAGTILRHTHVMSYARLRELCAPAPADALLHGLPDVAVLVQGNWVLRSALACASERDARCRDAMLLHFTNDRHMTTKAFADSAKLSTQAARELLAQVATSRPGHGWEFKLPTDTQFEAEHPQLALAQREAWLRLGATLRQQPLGAAAPTAPAGGAPKDGAASKRGKGAASMAGAGVKAAGAKATVGVGKPPGGR